MACPQTFMNRSGIAVRYLVEHYSPELDKILVVHDDVDIHTGRVKIVRAGGAGGHRGVESIISQLGTNRFNRIKIGIGRPSSGESVEEFVLKPLDSGQQKIAAQAVVLAVKAVELFILYGIEAAMNRYNSVIITEKEVEDQCKG